MMSKMHLLDLLTLKPTVDTTGKYRKMICSLGGAEPYLPHISDEIPGISTASTWPSVKAPEKTLRDKRKALSSWQ